jgi:8-oxo-dGTP diphosphatase
VEKGEKVEESMKRELMEEVGIVPKSFKLMMILNDIPNLGGQLEQALRFIFLIDKYEGKITNKEPDRCDNWEWFEKSKLPKPIFVGHVKPLKFFLSDKKDFFIEE